MESRHHVFGPSRWPALMECPKWKGKEGGADAKRGTQLHELFAKAIEGKETGPGDSFERNAVAIAERLREMAADSVIAAEYPVYTDAPNGLPEMGVFGTADAVWYNGSELHVADLKMVHNPDRDYRPQLLAYASGMEKKIARVDKVFLHYCYVDENKIVTEEYPAEEAQRIYEECYRRILGIAEDGEGEPKQCGWCQLCAYFESCTAPREVAVKVADENGKYCKLAKKEHFDLLSPKEAARTCVLADQLSKWCDAVKKNGADRAKAGEAIEDPENGIFYEVRERAGKLTIGADAAWEVAKPYVLKEEYKSCLDVSTTRLVDLLKKAGLKPKEAKDIVEAAVVRGEPTMVFCRRAAK